MKRRVKESPAKEIANESAFLTSIRVLCSPYLRVTALRCVASIFKNFFFLQYRAAFLPGLIPVSKVDHLLDAKIPFVPGKVNVYLDFVAFWVRTLGFLLRHFGRRALEPVRNFMETMGGLYAWASEVYRKNLSTTARPFYIKKPRFLLIHLVDPHLMCIPSLHVMVVIRCYTLFGEILKTLEEESFSSQLDELRRGALAITEAVLYVKQHSVNCIPAALYAVSRFDPLLFPSPEAERFVSDLFSEALEDRGLKNTRPEKEDFSVIRKYIFSLYCHFIEQGKTCTDWTEPLLDFLKEQPLF
jgi:hypothetical protein